ncbi:MAG: Acyl protein synthase/acyl-CoA reductase RfbN [Candidatus Woesebacteria bacterium GW2011_GWC1_42_9]|nr:MAG: Acyl protein synthase/acyl-CoA reductase RfbN [Candidatus Woesebacteria bacterium GW2011_GWC1_42_9]
MLLAFSKVRTNKVDGTEMLKCISVVLIDHADIENQKIMSLSAGTRIVWGGREIVELINELPKQPFCEDVIFGPKYSYALIDKDSLNNSFVKLASRLAIDVSVFDQYACSSPHVVFVETGGVKTALEFSQELAKQLEIVGRTLLPKDNIDTGKALEVVDLRSEYSLRGDRVIAPEGTEWTVVCSNQEGLPAGCYSRFIVVKSIDDFTDLKKFNDRQKQTLGVALTLENKRKWLDQLTVKGIDRCPDLGFATFYESPWDGLFLFDRLIRWVTTYK